MRQPGKVEQSVQVHIALGKSLKHDAEDVLKKMGLTITDAVRVFLRQVVKEQEIPFLVHYSAKTPNKETLNAIAEIEEGKAQPISMESLKNLWNEA